jgi:uncharacterized membrane protein
MSSNPYEAPKAPLSDYVPDNDLAGFRPDPKICEAGAGARWLAQGWNAFTYSPGAWILITLVWFLLTLVLLVIPMGSLAINLLYPVAMAGIMLGCEAMRRGEPLSVSHLFAGFNTPNTGQLVLVGAISLGAGIVVGLLVLVPIIGLGGMAFLRAISTGAQPDLQEFMLPLLLALLLYFALLLPLIMLLWFAPALVVFNKMPAWDAMKLSFSACLKNFVPYLVYSLVGLPIAILASIPLFLGWFIAMPIFFGSTYASYREIFYSD